MLKTDLIEAVNSKAAIAVIGSGVSVESGLPSWEGLLRVALGSLEDAQAAEVQKRTLFSSARGMHRYDECFTYIEQMKDRAWLEDTIRASMPSVQPGVFTLQLADWPFRSYVTTNYDSLLRDALHQLGHGSWTEHGNSDQEIRAVSGGVSEVIWHPHGALALPASKSTLVVTSDDYDKFYLHETRLKQHLVGLLSNSRVVFFGFGFNDPEFTRLLKVVKEHTSIERPMFAFLADIDAHAEAELLRLFNVEVISYQTNDGKHDALRPLLDYYGSFILGRRLRFNMDVYGTPSYDEQTSGLIIYNSLCLNTAIKHRRDVKDALLSSRILSILYTKGSATRARIAQTLREQSVALRSENQGEDHDEVNDAIASLREASLVEDDGAQLRISALGEEEMNSASAKAELMSRQFSSAIAQRVSNLGLDADAKARIASVAEEFLIETAKKRSLGMASAVFSQNSKRKEYQIAALMQALPSYMERLPSEIEAQELCKVVLAVLSVPIEAERRFLGLTMQAQFGMHLLGCDVATIDVRRSEFEGSLFILDASVIIPILAAYAPGYDSGRRLVELLQSLSCKVVTTLAFLTEVAEHLNWALSTLEPSGGVPNAETYLAVTGYGGRTLNHFLHGFVRAIADGRVGQNFSAYLSSLCGIQVRSVYAADDLRHILATAGISVIGPTDTRISDLDQFNSEVSITAGKLAEIRRGHDSFKHVRQVQAEAEAVHLVEQLRSIQFVLKEKITNAYFITRTAIVERVRSSNERISLLPDTALQWAGTLQALPVEELGVLFDTVAWELESKGLDVIDEKTVVAAFASQIHASRDQLSSQLAINRDLMQSGLIGSMPEQLPLVPDSRIILTAEQYYAQLTDKVRQEASALREAEHRLEDAHLGGKEKAELERFRAKKRERLRKHSLRSKRRKKK